MQKSPLLQPKTSFKKSRVLSFLLPSRAGPTSRLSKSVHGLRPALPRTARLRRRSAAAPVRADAPDRGDVQTLQGSFSAVSKPIFASKYAFESSRRDIHIALLRTPLKSHFLNFFLKNARICQNLPKCSEILPN